MERLPSSKLILTFLVLGFIVGFFFNKSDSFLGINFYNLLDLFSQLFLNSLKMIVIPLIMSSLIHTISSFSSLNEFSNLGFKTFIFYLFTSFVAIITGITLVNIIEPGIINGSGGADLIGLVGENNLDILINSQENLSIKTFFLNIFSGNIFHSIANGNMLFIILFSTVTGIAIRSSENQSVNIIKDFWSGAYVVFLKIMHYILFFTPYGVFCLVAKAVMNFTPESYSILLNFFVTVVLSLAIHFFIFYSFILILFKKNIVKHYKAMSPALLLAFSSSSSIATIPVTTKCLVDNLNYNQDRVNFIIPLGATINMDGTALFECIAVIFIAQLYGVDLSVVQQFLILFLALITSIGVAGIPSASFVAILVILGAVGLPYEAVAIILGVDRVLDMLRTSVNVFGDSCCASVLLK